MSNQFTKNGSLRNHRKARELTYMYVSGLYEEIFTKCWGALWNISVSGKKQYSAVR